MRHEERKIKKREKIDSKKRVNEKKEKKKKWCDVTKKRVRKREEESKHTTKFHYLETMKYHSIVLVLDFIGFK